MSTVENPTTSDEVVRLLSQPAAYSPQPREVQLVETHISWIFLTDEWAYKLKKPVQFDFLDFSSPHARRLACEDEVRLNRRLAPQVYRCVVPITSDERAGLALDGLGPEVDYVVKMRRLPSATALDQILCRHQLQPQQSETLIKYLIDFYRRLSPAAVTPSEYHEHLTAHCQANLTELLSHLGPGCERQLMRTCGALSRYVALGEPTFSERVRAGRVVEGHGDLRAEHVYLEAAPSVIDCVEFSQELRQVDVLDELSFLAMDCERLGCNLLGEQLIKAYEVACEDHPPKSLIAFYKGYRAVVRAKVAALRAAQQVRGDVSCDRQVHQYLTWAEHYTQQLGPPPLVVIGGLMGTGKSTLGAAVADKIAAEHLATDRVRQTMFGSGGQAEAYGEGRYHSSSRRRVYDALFARAAELIDDGRAVLLDGTFPSNELRRLGLEVARLRGAPAIYLDCACPRETSLARIRRRLADAAAESEARPELYDRQCSQREAVTADIAHLRVDTTRGLSQNVEAVLAALRALVPA